MTIKTETITITLPVPLLEKLQTLIPQEQQQSFLIGLLKQELRRLKDEEISDKLAKVQSS